MSQPLRYAIAGDHAGFAMKSDVVRLLDNLGVERENIMFDDFGI